MTFSELLARQLRHEPGRPLLTYYDETTGERVELSVATYANWVAKTASLLVDEHDLSRGDVLLVALPTHWLGPVFLGAAWTAGLAVAFPDTAADPPAAVVCGLPLLTKPERQRLDLLAQAFTLMQPDAAFIQFTYSLASPIPTKNAFFTWQASPRIWRNVPPARVWTYRQLLRN